MLVSVVVVCVDEALISLVVLGEFGSAPRFFANSVVVEDFVLVAVVVGELMSCDETLFTTLHLFTPNFKRGGGPLVMVKRFC